MICLDGRKRYFHVVTLLSYVDLTRELWFHHRIYASKWEFDVIIGLSSLAYGHIYDNKCPPPPPFNYIHADNNHSQVYKI